MPGSRSKNPMAFKRGSQKPAHKQAFAASRPGKIQKAKTQKHSMDRFRSTLDGSFDSLREADHAKKSTRPPAGVRAKPAAKRMTVTKKDIDESINKLAALMQ